MLESTEIKEVKKRKGRYIGSLDAETLNVQPKSTVVFIDGQEELGKTSLISLISGIKKDGGYSNINTFTNTFSGHSKNMKVRNTWKTYILHRRDLKETEFNAAFNLFKEILQLNTEWCQEIDKQINNTAVTMFVDRSPITTICAAIYIGLEKHPEYKNVIENYWKGLSSLFLNSDVYICELINSSHEGVGYGVHIHGYTGSIINPILWEEHKPQWIRTRITQRQLLVLLGNTPYFNFIDTFLNFIGRHPK